MGIEDDFASHSEKLTRLENILDCFKASRALPALLGKVVDFGNHLNAGDARLGQADGFHVEALGRPNGLDAVRDPEGNDVRQLLFKTWFDKHPEEAEQLLIELSPV